MKVYLIAGNSCEALERSLVNTGTIQVVRCQNTLSEAYDDIERSQVGIDLILLLDQGIDCSEGLFREWMKKYYELLETKKGYIHFKLLTKYADYENIFVQVTGNSSRFSVYLSDRVKVPLSMIITLCNNTVSASIEDTVIISQEGDNENTANGQGQRIQGAVLISVAGIGTGVGCTHTVITIANYLARQPPKYRVAVIDLHNGAMRAINEGYPEALAEGSFQYKNIHFYDQGITVAELIGEKYYDFIVQDLGPLEAGYTASGSSASGHSHNAAFQMNKYYPEMLRSHLPIIVANSQPWQVENLKRVLLFGRKNEKMMKDFVLYCTLSDQNNFFKVQAAVDIPCVKAAYNPALFESCEEQDRILHKLLQPVLSGTKGRSYIHGFSGRLQWGAAAVEDAFLWFVQNLLRILVFSVKFGCLFAIVYLIYYVYVR